MITEQQRTRLTEIAQDHTAVWAASRAGYMLGVADQLAQEAIDLAQAQAWMWDVLRHLDEDSDRQELAQEIRSIATDLANLTI